MDEPEAGRSLAERVKPPFDEIDRALEEIDLALTEPHAVPPRAPMLHFTEGTVEVPGETLEIPWPGPATRMKMHARCRSTQHLERSQEFALVWLCPGFPVE